ncbi:MAG: hypothetical protein ACPHGY_06435 [Rhodospirillaceae bacterium]
MRKANDNYPTPHTIIDTLLQQLGWDIRDCWEPCAGDGRFADAIDAAFGVSTVRHDIVMGQDFFLWDKAQASTLITNPPFKQIRLFIDHAFSIGVKRMALVCPERLWACKVGLQQYERHRPSRFVNLSWREDYLQRGKGHSPDRALAISIWDRPHSNQCSYEVWGKHIHGIQAVQHVQHVDVGS